MKPRPFAIAVVVIYVVNLVIFNYINLNFVARGGALPFLILEGLLTRSWYVLHAKRLADAGKGVSPPRWIATIFMLAVLFFVLMAIGANPPPPQQSETTFGGLLSLLLFASLLNGAQFGGLGYFFAAMALLPIIPILIVFRYSFVVGMQKPASA